MKNLLIAFILSFSSLASANSCLELVGEYVDCTTGDAYKDIEEGITRNVKISVSENKVTLTQWDNISMTYELNKLEYSETPFNGETVKLSTLVTCDDSTLKVATNVVGEPDELSSDALVLKLALESAPATYSLNGSALNATTMVLKTNFSCRKI